MACEGNTAPPDLPCKACNSYYGSHYHSEDAVAAIPVDAYVLDTLMPDLVGHDRQPSAFLVYLFLWRAAHGRSPAEVQVSLQDLTTGTGLSRRSVQSALGLLTRRRLIGVSRASITAVPRYVVRRPWQRSA